MNPAGSEGFRHGAWPTAQSTSAIAPHDVHTMWWWLSWARRSYRAADPAASMRRMTPASARSPSTLCTDWIDVP